MSVTFAAVLAGLKAQGVRLGPGAPPFAFGGPDGELRGEVWAICPACGSYGLRVDRRDDGRGRVACRQGCRPETVVVALASAVAGRAAG